MDNDKNCKLREVGAVATDLDNILPLHQNSEANDPTYKGLSTTELQALSSLRRMIIDGSIAAGGKISEASAAALIGLSRTPVRAALSKLEDEGLIEKREGRGYNVRDIKFEDIEKAIQVRGALEGLAAGCMAQVGPDDETRAIITHSIAATEFAVSQDALTQTEVGLYQDANIAFHDAVINRCGNELVARSYDRVRHIPTIRPGTFALNRDRLKQERIRMTVGHSHHVLVWDAIKSGEVTRADMLMREHADAPLNYARVFVEENSEDELAEVLRAI